MIRALLVGLLIAGVLAACGGGNGQLPRPTVPGTGPAGQTSGATPPADVDSCAVLSDEAIKAGTGHAVIERKKSTLTQVFPSVCDIDLDANYSSLEVNILSTGGKSLYETSFEPYIGQEGGYLETAVTDLGDKAGSSGDDTLMVLKGDFLFEFFYLEPGRSNKMASLRYLAQVLLGRLPCLATGCPDQTLPPALPTPEAESTDEGYSGGRPSPAGEQWRFVNLYADATGDSFGSGGTSLDIYAWDENSKATLLATVDYGQTTEFFDPGIGVNGLGDRGPTLSLVVHSQALVSYGFNVDDINTEPEPGTIKTIVLTPGDPTFPGMGGHREMGANHLLDHDPGGRDATDVLPDSGALYVNTDGLVYTGDALYYYLSVGNGCLALPDFPTVFRRVGGGHSTEGNDESADGVAVVPQGTWTLTIHPDTGAGDDSRCDNEPAAPGIPLTIANGNRAYLFPYRTPGDPQLRALAVPFGG